MKRIATFALVITATGLGLGLGTASVPAHADAEGSKLRGTVLALPDTSDQVGDWKIGDRVVRVDAGTRIEERDRSRNDGHWVHAPTGALVHAPAWHADLAYRAGFRPATPAEIGGVTLGSLVEVKLRKDAAGTPVAAKIEVERH
jgi:hypothetical protein